MPQLLVLFASKVKKLTVINVWRESAAEQLAAGN